MTRANIHRPDPSLDLYFERVVDVPRSLVWKAWTTPEMLKRTKYTALVIHGDADARKRHEALGFHDCWGTALDQLVALVRKMQVVGD